jgi:hypothetical protein
LDTAGPVKGHERTSVPRLIPSGVYDRTGSALRPNCSWATQRNTVLCKCLRYMGPLGLSAMMRSDLEVASDFVDRSAALPKERRARLGKQIPVAAVQVAALSHLDLGMGRFSLFLLDHYASDVSSDTFRRALHDPVASVRDSAVHGLACETCRHEDVCVPDVATDRVEILASDRNAEVRHNVAALARFGTLGPASHVCQTLGRYV